MEAKKKILIIQTAFLGDVILALPLVQTLKNIMPECIIDFLCIPLTYNVLENHPDINKIIKYDKKGKDKLGKLIEVISAVKKENYDVVLCPHRSSRSALITYFSKAPSRIGFNRNSLSFLLTEQVIYNPDAHEIQRNLDLLALIPGIEADDSKITPKAKLHPEERDMKLIDSLLKPFEGADFITLAPCSKWFTKQLTKEKATEIAVELFNRNYKVVLIGGAEDFEYCKDLEKEINSANLLNFCGRLSPIQSYCVIAKSKAIITVDSAAQHLGAASETPITLIYGSTNKSFGFFPLVSKSVIIEDSTLKCRPCTDHGRTKCPLGHFKCIQMLDAAKIVNETINLINN